jgi:hypothetical protein
MSKIENPKILLKKGVVHDVSYDNAHKTEKNVKKSVTIIFLYFIKRI